MANKNIANFDFGGYATKNDLRCSDGRVIRRNAFAENDGKIVPLVWNHRYSDPSNILGHAVLENRDDGVYAYCSFNDSENGQLGRIMVQHKDIRQMSIFANKLQHANGMDVIHGDILEVSLVPAGANPGAKIDYIVRHGEEHEEEADIFTGEAIVLHSEMVEEDESVQHADKTDGKKSDDGETVEEVWNTLTEKQKTVVYALAGQLLEEKEDDEDKSEKEGDTEVKQNVFAMDSENKAQSMDTLTHSQMETIISDAKRTGSLKEAFLSHAEDYGIKDIDWLFPEAKTLTNTPEFISRDMDWVKTVMNGVHHTPFSRIKSVFADITEDEARARGYIKGKKKKDEVFTLLKRTTTPTTIYKKQKLDRDDVIDITDFDVVAWIKGEMRMMLDEEIARAVLVGDGRLASSDDKIDEQRIRPIWKDDELYTIKANTGVSSTASGEEKAKAVILSAIKSRKDYQGSGNPIMFTTEDLLTDMLLLTDTTGRDLYDSVEKLATKMRVSRIITVPVLEGLIREDSGSNYALAALIVNLNDYVVGADKGGAISMFDDFDIDYNQQKYLIETRCSGALRKPHSAIAVEFEVAGG